MGQTQTKQTIQPNQAGAVSRGITWVAPFFLPALFFKSAWFAFISPLPLFILTLKNKPLLSSLGLLSNVTLMTQLGTPTESYIASGLWLGVGIVFPFLIRRTSNIQLSFGLSFAFLTGLILLALQFQAQQLGLGLVDYIRTEFQAGMDQLMQLPNSPVKKLIEEQGREGLFRQLMTELPSGILIGMVFCLWVNLLFASQVVPHFLSRSFWAGYRNPEWLLIPTLLFSLLFALTDHAPYYIGLNGMKLCLAFYGLQGLSIISYALNRYRILGLGRLVIFSFGIFVASPIVIALGFFDLWFDFRKKFGHS